MEYRRTTAMLNPDFIRPLRASRSSWEALAGDNREIMRHSSGAVHAAITEPQNGHLVLSLYGAQEFGVELQQLSASFAASDAGVAATDSNHNGAYVAYTQADGLGRAGSVAHFPDPFGDAGDHRLLGPLTPRGADVENSFLQASRANNTVVYGWRDRTTGDIFVGVSQDGLEFPPAQTLLTDPDAVRGPATGIQGDYVIYVYQSRSPRFAPVDSHTGDGAYYVWSDSGDGGVTWSEPGPLFPHPDSLPFAIGLSRGRGDDLKREEIGVSPAGSAARPATQLLAWANPADISDSRVFAMTALTPLTSDGNADWSADGNDIGLLAFKSFGVGGEWSYSITNRSLYRRADLAQPYQGRIGTLFKYSALPGTRVRVVTYVNRAPAGSELDDQIVVLVSTNKGDSFDYESTFTATSKHESTVVHVTLPIGLNVQGIDPTLVW